MIYSTLIGAYNVNLMPLDIRDDSITFSASAHTLDDWYITVNRFGLERLDVIHHYGDSDESEMNPMSLRTTDAQCHKLTKFVKAISASLIANECCRMNRLSKEAGQRVEYEH